MTGGRKGLLFALAPVAAALLAFAGTIPGDFVFDDAVLIQSDSRLRTFEPRRVFLENYWGTTRSSPNWRPLTLLSYALNFQVSSRPWAFHAVNVALNAAAAALFYLVARRVFRDRWLASGLAAVFAVLPIHSEAVANIVGRAELLAALGVLGAWWVALREGEREHWRAALAAGGLLLLGMLAKESAATGAALVPLSILILRGRFPWRTAAGGVAAVGVYLLLRALLLAAAPSLDSPAALVDNPLAGEPAAVRALNAVRLLGLYALRTVLPIHLSADHSFDQLPALPLSSPALWLGALGTAAAILGPVAILRRRSPAGAAGFLVFAAAFAATANVLFPIGTIFAERLAYLPSAGLVLALGGAFEPLSAARASRARAVPAFLAALVLVLGARTVARNTVWSDGAWFNVRLAEDSPRSTRAHLKAAEGWVLLSRRAASPAEREERLARAEASLAESLRILPINSQAIAFRAQLLVERGRWQESLGALAEAEEAFSRERVQMDPEVLYLRAEALFNLERIDEARAQLDAYLARKGPAAKAFNLRGVCAMKKGDAEAARADLDRAVALDPENAVSRMNRGILLAGQGKLAEARGELDAAVRLAPENAQVRANRGYLRFIQKDTPGALEDYREGLRLCEEKGALVEPVGGESAQAFRQRIQEVLQSQGHEN